MPQKDSYLKILKGNRPFLLFLAGQGASSLGDAFQLIAVTSLLFTMTGSGMSAAFGVICAPIPAILLSPVAGSLGDRFNPKGMLILLDLLRAAVAIFFIFRASVFVIYTVLLLLSILNVLYNPPSKRLIVGMLDRRDIMLGNSLLSGVGGISYLVGPVAAGYLVEATGTEAAFIINAASFIFCAFMTMLIKKSSIKANASPHGRVKTEGIAEGIFRGFTYLNSSASIKKIIVTCTVMSFGIASVNTAFYPFAFDVLKVTPKGWGLMISVFYGTSLTGMLIAVLLNKRMQHSIYKFVYIFLFIISMVWFCYGATGSMAVVLLLQLVEGTVTAVCVIALSAQLQLSSQKSFIGRAAAANELLSNGGKLLGIAVSYWVMLRYSPQAAFIVNSAILASFIMYRVALRTGGRIRHS
ncbi:transmembrane secretion effector [Anaerobacterium chartisolvens]|uniref:Transmembrane secretion effector n=1 Tax=Anaerobacterium chartisolvens TaxID=1297424 RepID=A0A369BAT0_9FIRM|nr:MFS transporter [Anaerobacterium chartisolvens]RCX17617.1 transmembrane secretion effector [Anaerobacterium chartisolvens]